MYTITNTTVQQRYPTKQHVTRIKYASTNPFINISINELTQEVTQFRSGEINNTLPLQRFKPFNGKISGSHEDIDSSRWVKGPMPFSGNDPRNCFTQSAIMRLKISRGIRDQPAVWCDTNIIYCSLSAAFDCTDRAIIDTPLSCNKIQPHASAPGDGANVYLRINCFQPCGGMRVRGDRWNKTQHKRWIINNKVDFYLFIRIRWKLKNNLKIMITLV